MGSGASVAETSADGDDLELWRSLGVAKYLWSCTSVPAPVREATTALLSSLGDVVSLEAATPQDKHQKLEQLRQLFATHRTQLDPSIWQPVEQADPWRSVPVAQQYARVKGEEGVTISCDTLDEVQVLIKAQGPPSKAGYRVVLEGCDLSCFRLEERPLREAITSLDLSSNRLEDEGGLSLLLPNSLRQLNLSSNPLSAPPLLLGCSLLLSLDLSYVTSMALQSATFAPLPHLLQLRLQGCGLQSLTEPSTSGTGTSVRSIFCRCRCLQDLCLAENEIPTLAAVEAGVQVLRQHLMELDLRDNPVSSDSPAAYRKGVLALLPSLAMLDNLGTGTTGVALDSIAGLRDQVERNRTLIDENAALEVDAALKGKKDLSIIS